MVFLFYLFCFFYSLVKRRTLQVRLVYLTVALWTAPLVNIARHTLLFRCRVPVVQQPFTSREQIVADPLPQILDGVQQSLVGKQIVDVPVSKILVGIVGPVAYRHQATVRVDVLFISVPQILEQIVEVIEVILQKQCQ